MNGGYGETWVGRNTRKEELEFKSAQGETYMQKAAGRMVSVSMGEKGEKKEYRGRQITL